VSVTPPEPEPQVRPGLHLLPGRGELRHLAGDSRWPVWRTRLIICLIVFTVITIVYNLAAGLTVAVLAGIADAILRGRSNAANIAQGLTTGAQRRTKKQLSKMERAGYRALHIRAIPGSDEVIDHLLVGPTGVYAIDSEQWDKQLPVRNKNGRSLYHGPFSQKARLEHAVWEAGQASDLIGDALGEDITVRPAMVVYGPSIPWGVITIRGVDVFGGDRLRKYLRSRTYAGVRRPKLSAEEVQRIYTAAERVLPPKTAMTPRVLTPGG